MQTEDHYLLKYATDTKYAIGNEVVIASIRKIQDTCIFPNDLLFLRRVAWVESKDGDSLKSFWNSDKGKNGIWQTWTSMLSQVQNSGDPTLSDLQNQLGVNMSDLNWSKGDLDIPLNDAALARLYTNMKSAIPLDINDQAAYWVNNFNPSGTVQQFISAVAEMPKCKPPGLDLIFIIDDSGSIGADVFQNVRNFMTTIISALQTGQSNRVGIVRFDDSAFLDLALTYNLDYASQVAASIPYNGEGTNISSGLSLTYQQFLQFGRTDIPMIALLITDGEDSEESVVVQANNLKNFGVNLFTVGVGSAATSDLLLWSSIPHCMYYYSLNDYSQLAQSFPELLNSQICDVTARIPTTEGCVNADSTTGITVRLEMNYGAASIYVSLTSRLPSAADYDFYANANVELPGQIYISPDQLQTGTNNSTVYAAIVGLTPENSYTLCNEKYDTIQNYTTPAPFSTNSSCISLDLIFILDRSQSVYEDYYNINVTNFVLDIANQFAFHDEATAGNPAFARFGVIEFSSTPSVTIPLGNYTRKDFNTNVTKLIAYSVDEGTTRIGEAFMAALNQFKQNSLMRNQAFILVVDDVTTENIQDAKDALNKLKQYNNILSIGTIMTGSWGDLQDGYKQLSSLLGNKNVFPSMDDNQGDILNRMDTVYPCTALPACSAIIFVEEASTAIGQPSKIKFLQLVSKLVNSIEHTPNQRFGLALYAASLSKDVEFQLFDDFNRTLNDYINTITDNDSPNGGTTNLIPAVHNIGQATKYAQSIADSGANVYVLDETKRLNSVFWDILTGHAYGHVINGTNATPELLYATFSQTIIPEFLAKGC
uniref:VWFA domain-containing protein n=1 Tax=Panagrolaimus sp. ES5 TaxID=591445 RepID=A0AC34FV04_9BILA